jgi:ribonuclease HIII
MKTAISLPDKVYNDAMRASQVLHVSLNTLYLNALSEYLSRLQSQKAEFSLSDEYNKESAPIKMAVLDQWRELTKDDTW